MILVAMRGDGRVQVFTDDKVASEAQAVTVILDWPELEGERFAYYAEVQYVEDFETRFSTQIEEAEDN